MIVELYADAMSATHARHAFQKRHVPRFCRCRLKTPALRAIILNDRCRRPLLKLDQKFMLPEEKELTRLEAEQTKLQERATAAELEFETLKIETARFRHRHNAAVGHLYAQLDEIEAKIANARARLRPEDSTLKSDAGAAKKRAKESAAEAGLMSANLKPTTAASPDLKQAYREAVKLVHPDLALSNHEQQRRTKLMAEINQAYELGDKGRIKKMIEEFGMDPEAITGQDIGSRIVRAIRRIAQLRRRLVEVQEEIRSQQKTEISQLREVVEKAELNGGDPLGDLQQKLKRQIFEHKCRFEGMNGFGDPPRS
jgi:hypothetical protein